MIEEIEEIENKIKQLVKQYAAAQKQYNGDSQKSKDLEAEIDSLEIRLKLLKEGQQEQAKRAFYED